MCNICGPVRYAHWPASTKFPEDFLSILVCLVQIESVSWFSWRTLVNEYPVFLRLACVHVFFWQSFQQFDRINIYRNPCIRTCRQNFYYPFCFPLGFEITIDSHGSGIRLNPKPHGPRKLYVQFRLDACRPILPYAAYNGMRKFMRRQLARSLGNDLERWWIEWRSEVERTAFITNSRNSHRPIRKTGTRKPRVSEVIAESGCSLIHS